VNPSLVYAFGVGMVATFNPCGFAMLPAYLSYFLGLENKVDPEGRDLTAAVLRALAVGATMTGGFVAVFALLGLGLEPILSTVQSRLPWVTIILGVGLVVVGVMMLRGRTFTVNLPKLNKGTDSRELTSVFLFGVSYAIVSLSCTISLFIAAVVTTIDTESFAVGVGAFVAYALGMGLVLTVLTVALALARQSMVGRLRRVLPYVNRVSGALLIVAGLYVAYYGWYELQVLGGDLDPGGPARWVFDLNGTVSTWITDVGPTRLGLVLALAIAVVVLVVLVLRARREDRPDGSDETAVPGPDSRRVP
jgi:cytochrome c biogenesis protein CcdA